MLFKKTVTFDFVYILSSAYIDQSAPTLDKIWIWMSSIMGLNGPEQLELLGLELWKIAAFDFVNSLTSTNTNQSAPNLVTMNMSIRSQMSLIMGRVIPDQLVFSVLEIEKLNFTSLFGIYLHCSLVLLSTQVSNIGPSWSSCCQNYAPFLTRTFLEHSTAECWHPHVVLLFHLVFWVHFCLFSCSFTLPLFLTSICSSPEHNMLKGSFCCYPSLDIHRASSMFTLLALKGPHFLLNQPEICLEYLFWWISWLTYIWIN